MTSRHEPASARSDGARARGRPRDPRGLRVVVQRQGEGRPLAADRGGPALREADPRRPAAHRAGDPGAVRGIRAAALLDAQALEPALGRGSARRHEGVRAAKRRFHREHRAGRQPPARARRRARPGARARLLTPARASAPSARTPRRRAARSASRNAARAPSASSAAARTAAARSTASWRASVRTNSSRSAVP